MIDINTIKAKIADGKKEEALKDCYDFLLDISSLDNQKTRMSFGEVMDLFCDLNKELGRKVSENPLIKELHKKYCDKKNIYFTNALGNLYFNFEDCDQAIKYYLEAVDLATPDQFVTKARYLYNVANAYSRIKKDYGNAISYYEKAIEVNKEFTDAYFNLGLTYKRTFQYEKTREAWKQLTDILDKADPAGDTKEIRDWKLSGDHFQYNLQNYKRAFDEYLMGYDLALKEDDPASFKNKQLLVEMVRASFKQCDLEPDFSEPHYKWHRIATEYSTKALAMLKEDVEPDIELLGAVYLAQKNYSKALAVFSKLPEDFPNMESVSVCRATCYQALGRHEEAISELESLDLKVIDIDYRSQLAEAYLLGGRPKKAEEKIQSILNKTSYHTKTNLIFIDLHKQLGDSHIGDNQFIASVYYDRAKLHIEFMMENVSSTLISNHLSNSEISNLNYSLGYIYVQLYKVSGRPNEISDLTLSLKSFKNVKKADTNYHKAAKAINKLERFINERIDSLNTKKVAAFIIGSLIGVVAILLVSIGKPKFTSITTWHVNNHRLLHHIETDTTLAKVGITEEYLETLFNDIEYDSLNQGLEDINRKITGIHLPQKNSRIYFKPDRSFTFSGFDTVEPTVLIFLLTLSGAFIIIGLVFENVTKLKFGEIELERTQIDSVGILDFKILELP